VTLPVLLDAAQSADAVPLRPPPRLEEAVLDRFARERAGVRTPAPGAADGRARRSQGGRWRRALAPALAAAACALAAVAAFVVLTGDDAGNDNDALPVAEQPRVYSVGLTGAGPAREADGEARLYPAETGTGVHLQVSGLDPDAYSYELWCVRDDGWRVSAGTFRVDANGRADVNLTTSARPSEYDAIAVRARPAGRGADTEGRRVLIGRLRS
jgi:anti-sigma-K factor RskA